MNQGLGYTSCEQVFEINARFRKHLQKGNLAMGKLRDTEVFQKLLELTVSKTADKKEPLCVILTKPPETIALCYMPKHTDFPFTVFELRYRNVEWNGVCK